MSAELRGGSGDACSVLRGQPSGPDVRRLLVCAELGLQWCFKYLYFECVWLLYRRFFDCFSVICNKTFYKVHTLLLHTPHHTKSPLGSRGRDTVSVAVCAPSSGHSNSTNSAATLRMEIKQVAASYFLRTINARVDLKGL